ncbi:MAG: hypothetical protein ACI8RZ_003712, partial [Myxococcota bacterium]
AKKSIYTAPIKALVSEKFFDLCRLFGAEYVGMVTGDGTINRDAPIICCTAEILEKLSMNRGGTGFSAVIMDEFHYYGDRDRGRAWQIPLLTMPKARFLLMSATLGDTSEIAMDLEERTGAPVVEVTSAERPVPLTFRYATTPIHETLARTVLDGYAPVYVVHFTQRQAAETAGALLSSDFCSKAEKKIIETAVKGFRFDSPYGSTLRRYLTHGIGLHHAGLLPKYRLLVEKLAQSGLLKAICGTDTLGVGINVPIRTVLFTQLCKYDGEKVGVLTVRDFKQISGRAGRKGFDDEGLVLAQAPAWVIENNRLAEAVASGKRNKKKFVRRKPPNRGYKHWDEQTFERLIAKPPEALVSQFSLDHGLLISMLRSADEIVDGERGDGLKALHTLIDDAHTGQRQTETLHTQADQLLADLVEAGLVDETDHTVREGLQRDFSLHQSLSLFLLHALSLLDKEAEDYHLDVLTMVEAVLEHPRAILYAQVSQIKGKLIGELKAAGVPYEERVAELETITWNKPKETWIYTHFNEYAATRPWVTEEAIRPKSIAREMVEQYAAFHQYISELKMIRAEGVLLRYLTQVYQALARIVPEDARTPELVDTIAFLRAMLARVDSSLLTEWEKMNAEGPAESTEPHKVDISADKRTFLARIRAEMHAMVRALSREEYDEAVASVQPGWTSSEIETAIAPYHEEYGPVIFDALARLAHNTIVKPNGPHQWRVQQVLLDVEEDNGWSINGIIDLREDTNPEGPLILLETIGE